jgi:hypothetical protein
VANEFATAHRIRSRRELVKLARSAPACPDIASHARPGRHAFELPWYVSPDSDEASAARTGDRSLSDIREPCIGAHFEAGTSLPTNQLNPRPNVLCTPTVGRKDYTARIDAPACMVVAFCISRYAVPRLVPNSLPKNSNSRPEFVTQPEHGGDIPLSRRSMAEAFP